MMPLTRDEQETVERLYPVALALARHHGDDDELESVATLALVEAVIDFRGRTPIDTLVRLRVRSRLRDYLKAEEIRRRG